MTPFHLIQTDDWLVTLPLSRRGKMEREIEVVPGKELQVTTSKNKWLSCQSYVTPGQRNVVVKGELVGLRLGPERLRAIAASASVRSFAAVTKERIRAY
ncbi:hypothetical protein CDO22_34920 (plasmid) [Sinorhizobium meliloti]|nr:hypothetical protein CDO22_34920 [Sinorhizobium meliloti]